MWGSRLFSSVETPGPISGLPCIAHLQDSQEADQAAKIMKMLFFSSDDTEVQQLSQEFTNAGIPCEVHNAFRQPSASGSNETELWIRNDQDCHRALMLCVQRNMGFARRPVSAIDELDYDSYPAFS
jgi:Putative prokaryotic signal transducing protein